VKPRIEYNHIWLLAGAAEELRNRGAVLPPELDCLLSHALKRINFPDYMNGDFARRDGPRIREILESLDVPGGPPGVYREPAASCFSRTPRLAPFCAEGFFEDTILGVGLKSYPFVLDFDGDGRKDLLVGDHDGFIYVYLNQGSDACPSFGRGERLRAIDTGAPMVVRPNPKMSFGDLTGSGSLDLVLGNYGGEIPFAPNRASAGRFEFAIEDVRPLRTRRGPIEVGNYAYPELAARRQGGPLDLIVGSIDGRLRLYRNLGAGGGPLFDEGEDIAGIQKLMYPYPVATDWNGDGRLDLTLGHREGTILIYINTGTAEAPRFEYHGLAMREDGEPVRAGMLSHHFVCDWNNDGRKDLVVGGDSGQITVFLNVGSDTEPVFDEGHVLSDGGGELILGVHPVFAMADLYGAGRRDLLAGYSEEGLRVFRNTGTAERPAFGGVSPLPDVDMRRHLLAAGDPEAGAFWDLSGLDFNREYLGNCAPCAVDWRNTGKLDLLVGHYTGLVYLFENIGAPGAPRFGKGHPLRLGSRLLRVAGFSAPVVCDWNNDGRKDLIVGDMLGRVHVFLNTGSDAAPAFDEDTLVQAGGEPVALGPRSIVDVADLDGDGRKDLIVGNRRGGVYALMNTGSDAAPVFDAIERLRHEGALWRRLYDGFQHSVAEFRRTYDAFPDEGKPAPMSVLETSCPRAVDLAGNGQKRLLVSHRYGRVFLYNALPRPASLPPQ